MKHYFLSPHPSDIIAVQTESLFVSLKIPSFFVKTPKWVRAIYPNQVWNLPTTNKEIYLTFDDGPTPKITDWVIDTLHRFDAKATFFCIGKNIEEHPEIINRIIKYEHTVGNHTYNHEKGWKTNNEVYLNSVLKTDRLIEKSTINNHKLFRPPYGKIKNLQTKELTKNNYKVIMWSVLSGDFDKSLSAENCLTNVLKNVKSGDIVVFHDSVKAFDKLKFVLPKVLQYYSERGFKFKKINP